MQEFQRADSRVSRMENGSVLVWKQETIKRQQEKRRMTTSLIFI